MKNHSLTRKIELFFFRQLAVFPFFPQQRKELEMLLSPRLLKSKWIHMKTQSFKKKVKKKKKYWNWDTRENPSSIFNTNLDNRMLSCRTIFSYICSWYAIQCVIFLDVIARNSKNRSAKGNCEYNIMCGYKNWNPLFCEALHRRFEKSTFH